MAEKQIQVQKRSSLCNSSGFSLSPGAAANPEFISMQSALIWDAGGRGADRQVQTNKLQKQRAGDAADPDGCEAPGYGGWVETGRGAGRNSSGGEKPLRITFFVVIHHEQSSQLTSLKKAGDAFLVSRVFLMS